MKYYLICDASISNNEVYTTRTGTLKCKGDLVLHPVPDSITDPTLISQLDPVLIANAIGAGFMLASVLFAMAFSLKVIVNFIKKS